MSLRLRAGALKAIQAAAEAGYPHEVCGILLGRAGGSPVAEEAHPCDNVVAERSRDRYELDPKAQLRIEKGARERGLDVVGYFHSHPDHPALASATDDALSWERTVYLIQSVRQGRCDELRAWARGSGEPRLQPLDIETA